MYGDFILIKKTLMIYLYLSACFLGLSAWSFLAQATPENTSITDETVKSFSLETPVDAQSSPGKTLDDAFLITPEPNINTSHGDLLFANNRLLALSGTSYFLRHENIVADSVIIQIEVRDKKESTLATYPLAVGVDYTVDGLESRLALTEPVYYAIDEYFYGNPDSYFIFLQVSYQYIDTDYLVSIDTDYVSLDGGVNWFVESGGRILTEQELSDDLAADYGIVQSQNIALGAKKHRVYNASNTLIDGFLIGIIDTQATQRKITGNRALATSGRASNNKTLLTQGKVQLYYRGVVRGDYLVNVSLDTEREDNDILDYIDPDTNYAIYGDESNVKDLSTKASGLLYLLVEKDNSKAEWGRIEATLPAKELTEFNRSLDGLGVHYETNEKTKYGTPKTIIDTYYAQLKEKRTRNEFLSTGSVIYYLRFTTIRETSLKVSLEVRDHASGEVIRTQELTSQKDFEIDANSGRLLFTQPIKQYVPSGIIATDDTDTDNDIYIIASYNYAVSSTDLDQSVLAARLQQAVSDDVVLGVQHQAEDQSNSTFKSSAIDAKIRLDQGHIVDVEFAQSNLAIDAPYTSTDGGITWQQASVDNNSGSKTDDAISIKGVYDNKATKDNIQGSYYYKNIASNFSQKTSSNLAGKQLLGFDVKHKINELANVRVKFDNTQDLDNLFNQNWEDSQQVVIQGEYLLEDVLKITAALSDNTSKKHTANVTQTVKTQSQQLAIQGDYQYSKDTIFTLRQQLTLSGQDNEQTTVGVVHQLLDNLKVSADTTFYPELDNKSNLDATYYLDNGLSLDLGVSQGSDGAKTSRVGGKYNKDGLSLGAGIAQDGNGGLNTNVSGGYSKDDVSLTAGVAQDASGQIKTTVSGGYSKDDVSLTAGVSQDESGKLTTDTGGKYSYTTQSNQTYRVSAYNQTNSEGNSSQALVLGATTPVGDNTTLGVDTTTNVSGDNIRNTVASNVEHKFNDEQSIKAQLSRYTESDNGVGADGYDVKVSGNLDKNWALDVNLGQGYVQNASDTQDRRTNYGIGTSYVRRDALGGSVLKSSLRYQERQDRGQTNRTQRLVDAKVKGKYNPDTTLSGVIAWEETQNQDNNSIEASNNRFDINAAYRPLKHNKFNALFKYTWVENVYATEQVQENSLEADKGHVLSSDLFYKLNNTWQIGTKLAQRFSKEQVGGIWFDNTISLLATLAQYQVAKDTYVSLEARTLYNKRANDKQSGLVLEIKRRFNEYIEGALGYNWAGYSDDLAALDYNIQGWYIRATGVLW